MFGVPVVIFGGFSTLAGDVEPPGTGVGNALSGVGVTVLVDVLLSVELHTPADAGDN
jgi:hypothetical protein